MNQLFIKVPDPKELMSRLGYTESDYTQDPIDPFMFHPVTKKNKREATDEPETGGKP